MLIDLYFICNRILKFIKIRYLHRVVLNYNRKIGLLVPYHRKALDPLTSRITEKLKRFESENKDKATFVYPRLKGFVL